MEIGTDIARISDFVAKGENFYRRFLVGEEYVEFISFKNEKRRAEFAAARWAGKEAIFKATQDPAYLSYEILHESNGKPYIKGRPDLKISLSHHAEYAIAFVIKTDFDN